jgi:ADP-ribosyl-[dinitrogen reductase] hydrolase
MPQPDRPHFLYLMALADSYGMKYEFVPHKRDKTAADLFHEPHPKFNGYKTGHYTDDTQMSLANMEVLLAHPGKTDQLTEDDFVTAWIKAFKRDPHDGYSKYLYQVMTDCQTPADFKAAIDPAHSPASGAAMRAGPFGLLADINEVKRLAKLQGDITHTSPAGAIPAQVVALSVHFLHHGGSRTDLPAFLEKHLGADWNSTQKGYTTDTGNGQNILRQALDAVYKAKTLSDVLLHVVNAEEKSDTDTICAIAMVIASRARDLLNDLPQKLTAGLENGTYGADYLKSLDQKAMTPFPSSDLYRAQPSATKQNKNAPRP